jgi:signal transduction histidine kinase
VLTARETSGEQQAITMEIRDRGPGIPSELREKVFEPFFSNRADGTGLGLAIVRQILDNHHGAIGIVDSDEPGCTVRLTLPLPPATPWPS